MQHKYIVDTKLLAYYLIQRGRSISDIFNKLAELLVGLKSKGDVYLCFDVGKSEFRLKEQSYYKGHRKKALAKKSTAEQLAHEQFNEDYLKLMGLFEALGIRVIGVEGVEADDLASIISRAFTNKSNTKVTLLTGDYDWLHMVVDTTNVVMFDFPKRAVITHQDILEKYGVTTRRQFSIKKAIVGDKSDNIKFIRNLAEAKGGKLFEDIHEKYEDPTDDDIIAEIEAYIEEKPHLCLYKHHIDDKRVTIRDAFLSNMKIADPFPDLDNLTPEQKEEVLIISKTTPQKTVLVQADFTAKTIEVFGYPVLLSEKAKKVYGVRDE